MTISKLRWFLLAAIPLLAFGAGCSATPKTPPESTYQATGLASYYGKKFHGRHTASGERFNMHAMTATHRHLKFGAKVKVTNLKNGKSVVVRINDRGPFIKGRIIDLSYAAAGKLGMLTDGITRVRLTAAR